MTPKAVSFHVVQSQILDLMRNDPWRMTALASVRAFGLKDWAIGAGFVRAAVWDALSNYPTATPIEDIDVVYFDRKLASEHHEKRIERRLSKLFPAPWSVKNQARMHRRNNNLPYHDTSDALGHWLETPTCVAVRLDANDDLRLIAPHGIDDLVRLRIRPTPAARRRMPVYRQRLRRKNWRKNWPALSVHMI